MNKIVLKIKGMSCSACSNYLEKYLSRQNGILNVSVNLVLAQALIEYNNNLKVTDLNRMIKEAGYESLGEYNALEELENTKKDKYKLISYGILAIVLLYISMAHMLGFPAIYLIDMYKFPINYGITLLLLTIPFLIYGMDIIINGWKKLLHGSPNMDTLVSIGVLSSFLYSLFNLILIIYGKYNNVEYLYFESVAMVIYFIKSGRFIESRSKEKTKKALKELVQITPSIAFVKYKNEVREVTIDEVKKDNILVAKPGMKIAVDGVVTEGKAYVDEAFITGESSLIKKTKGSKVVAGSINLDGYIEYRAVKIGKDSMISEIVKLVVEASNTKAPIARLADNISGYFIPIIIAIAILTFVFNLLLGFGLDESFNSFVTVLVVACPCALGLATPLAIVVSEGKCAQKGILVKSSDILENIGKIDTIVFDKTGTLTYGKLKISWIYNYSQYSDNELIRLIASVEDKSTHPISLAFLNYVKDNNLEISKIKNFENIPGMGIKGIVDNKNIYAGNSKLLDKFNINNNYIDIEKKLSIQGNSIVYVVEDNDIIGVIGIKDIVRNNAKKVINCLKEKKIDVIMLTGDNENTANMVAQELMIDKVIANVEPKDKADVINELKENGAIVMMVGDGINDAVSLISSDIGVSMNSATDIATDAADVILIHDNLANIIDVINISKKTIINIKQNLFWAFFYNICMITIATGIFRNWGLFINPMVASFAMMLSSLTVVLNSLRLNNIRLEDYS